MSWPFYPELLATLVPRYTSYPTAAEFHGGVGADEMALALAGLAAGTSVSLYVHFPYCREICWYCGCNTGAANRHQRLTSYLDALHREIALVAELLPSDARVKRIAFGGGSPNAIAPLEFVRLMDALALNFPLDDPLISIELDPRTLSDEWGVVIGGIGASHASLGVQTFAPHLQEAIGRIQPLHMIEHSVRLLRDGGIRSLNFDLMYGLPGQSRDDLTETLGRAAEFGSRRLVAAGYRAVGFDHFALPADPLGRAAAGGTLRRNFQGFTDDQATVLIGLGASAISSFPHLLVQNEKNQGRYRMLLSQDLLSASLGIARTEDDRRRGGIIEGLLCHGRAAIPRDLAHETAPRLEPFFAAGLCESDGATLAIGPAGLPYARSIAAQFDPYRGHSPRRFSSAV